jgi:hypothetical protein
MKKKIINVKVNLSGAKVVSDEDIKNLPCHTIRHFSFVNEREIKQTAARELWDRTVYNKECL